MLVARQPILDRRQNIFAYELLYRDDEKINSFNNEVSSLSATAGVVLSLFESGAEKITENKKAFINFDENLLKSDVFEIISPDKLVIEVLENVKIDDELVNRLFELKEKGYTIALDDFFHSSEDYALIDVCDIIKYDFLNTDIKKIIIDSQVAQRKGKTILAEKVETKEEFEIAKKIGFTLFQGYFFEKPKITSSSNDKVRPIQYTSVISELNKEEPSFDRLADIIEKDLNLSYRLMRMMSIRNLEINRENIKKSLTYMGLKGIERWINIVLVQTLGKNCPRELVKISLIRASFAERIALNVPKYENLCYQASIVGLFNALDAILNMPLDEALKDLKLDEIVKDALLKDEGILAPIKELYLSYEKGEFDKTSFIAENLGLDDAILTELYIESIEWANRMMQIV
ncbi:MAG: EAL domain-containing protein [Tissierellales bacterium]|nr:EAL domain-containing protein [Tissierellales bacterium]